MGFAIDIRGTPQNLPTTSESRVKHVEVEAIYPLVTNVLSHPFIWMSPFYFNGPQESFFTLISIFEEI